MSMTDDVETLRARLAECEARERDALTLLVRMQEVLLETLETLGRVPRSESLGEVIAAMVRDVKVPYPVSVRIVGD